MGRDDILSPRQVEALIAEGGVVVIFEDYVLRLNSWMERHPGGKLAILHMVGKDATDEILA
jgi:delta8-fatty-acid desaturase